MTIGEVQFLTVLKCQNILEFCFKRLDSLVSL
jgi:hypothetical protein